MRRQPQNRKGRNTVKRSTLTLLLILTLALAAPAFAQHSHPGGGPPAGHGPASDPGTSPGMSNSHGNSAAARSDVSHGTPSDVLSHNTAIAGKIKSLTGLDAQTACGGFKNIGQCMAPAHFPKNLNIPRGFAPLTAKLTGSGSLNLR